MRVLIVEDEPLIALDIEDALFRAGFTAVDAASDLQHALEAVATGTFDVAIVDPNLGSENAGPVMLALKARSVPFVCVSGCTSEQCLPEGAGAPYLSKPFDQRELVACLLKLVLRPAA